MNFYSSPVPSTMTISKALKKIFEERFPNKKYEEHNAAFRVFTKDNLKEVEIPNGDRLINLVLNYPNLYVDFKQQKILSIVSNNFF